MTVPRDDMPRLAAAIRARLDGTALDRFEAAEAERVAPILYYGSLHGSGSEHRDPRFKSAYYRCAGQNVGLFGALADVAAELADHDIRCVAIKGADLARTLYPSVGLRPMGDVDIYVSPRDAERAEVALLRFGYRPWTPDMTRGLSRRIRHARLFVGGPRELAAIDLHWSLVGHGDDARAPEREWIDRHTRRSGETWDRLSETAHLLYLAAHMKLQHYDETIPLLWLVDFHRLASSGNVDWDELFHDAARFGWTGAVRACAHDARERLGLDLPAPLAARAAAPARPLHVRGARLSPERAANELRTLGWRGRIALIRAYLLPSPDYVRFRYPMPDAWPSWTWPIGYVRRWWRVGVKGLLVGWRLLFSSKGARPLWTPEETW